MKSSPCRPCIESDATASDILAMLNNPPEKCSHCASSVVMRVVSEQFRMGVSQWWVVDGVVVVPVWAVELLKTHLRPATAGMFPDRKRIAIAA